MKNIILAAGYATRLYPLTENFPKPLLKIGESTILDRLMADIDRMECVDEHILVTNHKFVAIFESWAAQRAYAKPIRIIDDGSVCNEKRLGAVNDLLLAISGCDLLDDLLVIAADNILDFSLKGFVDGFFAKGSSMIMCHHEPSVAALQRTGVIVVDEDFKVLQMQEKPLVPASNWAVPPFYIYRKEDLPLIMGAVEHGCQTDAPGNLAGYMFRHTTLHAWVMPGKRYDIGTVDSYHEAMGLF
jgi:glucose-1-phosphate thymidylyltransferase